MGMQQRVPQYVPSISSLAQCMAKERALRSRADASGQWKPSLWRESREAARETTASGLARGSELITLCISETGQADPVEESLEILIVEVLANLHGWITR